MCSQPFCALLSLLVWSQLTDALVLRSPAALAIAPSSARAPGCELRVSSRLRDEAEYKRTLADAERQNTMIVIKFHASWCRACKAMAPKLARIADDWPDIEFYEIMFDNNKKLFKSLNIRVLPYIEIVAGSKGKVEGFSCGPSKVSKLIQKLEEQAESLGHEEIDLTDVSDLLPDD